jgi:hypothetical protein
VLDGAEPAARGPRFLWKEWPTARLLRAERDADGVHVVAEVPGRVRRVVRLGQGTLTVTDEVLDRAVREVACTWLVHPGSEDAVTVAGPGAARVEPVEDAVDAWLSPTYGVRVPALAVRVHAVREREDALTLESRLSWRLPS